MAAKEPWFSWLGCGSRGGTSFYDTSKVTVGREQKLGQRLWINAGWDNDVVCGRRREQACIVETLASWVSRREG
jgi:hypothetical protein